MKPHQLLVLLIPVLGCSRAHLTPDHGRASRQLFTAQVINKDAGSVVKADPGLDPEEAAAVADTYRRSMSKEKEKTAEKAPIVVIEPRATGAPAAAQP